MTLLTRTGWRAVRRGTRRSVTSSASTTSVRSSLWFVPVMCVLAGLVLSAGTLAIDRMLDFELVPMWLTGGPDAAIGIFTTIAASMVSLTALVLTITMVVVQLAMGQFSPRIVQTFLRDKPSQLAIGLFVATFAHAMVAMREVGFDEDERVPGLAIVVSYVLVLTSIAMLVLYVHHIGRSLRVAALIELVGDDTRKLLDRTYPDLLEERPPDPQVVCAPDSGVVTHVDIERLVDVAHRADCVLHVVPALGEFVPAGAPLVRIEGDAAGVDSDAVARAIMTKLERTLEHDVAYGIRLLVDMAERSVSDSPFLDPTTAVQAIDRLHDGLRHLCERLIPDGRHADAAGALRVTAPVMTWEAYVHLAFDEIRLAGAESPQVTRRLAAALEDLVAVAPPQRRGPLQEQLRLLRAAASDLPRADADHTIAIQPDGQGIGVGVDGHSRQH